MLVVIGGHSRNIGKTSVVTGLISAIPEAQWRAIKITQYGHNVCQDEGEACDCAPGDAAHRFALDRQRLADTSDTGRYLAAGASDAWWLRTAQGDLGHALPVLSKLLAEGGNWIVESNSLLRFYRPNLYLVVLDYSNIDMKESARLHMDRADAFIVVKGPKTEPPWRGVPGRWFLHKPEFLAAPPDYAGADLVSFVRTAIGPARLSAKR